MSDLVPVKNTAKYGVLTDPDPYDLPPGAWSFGVNARFRNGKVTRGPVMRSARHLSSSNPRYVLGHNPVAGTDNSYVGYSTGRVFKTTPSAETDYSIAGYSNSVSEAVWSHCHLADVLYVNREDHTPWYLRTSDSQFQDLHSGAGTTPWDATWRCHLLRSVGSALVALNVTKGGVNYPTMVKTSSFATVGTVPVSWDYTTPATNSTENILAELEGPIVDAQILRADLYIYSLNETWVMRLVGGTDVWDYFKVYDNRGAINANCSIEIEGRHYVFGLDDIWSHDGVSPESICDGITRDYIFRSVNIAKANRCFVTHNAALKEICFCYVSGDANASFFGADGCNRQAVYNYATKTWTFDDLPFVYSGNRVNLDSTATYVTITTTYATVGGTYQDQEASFAKTLVYVGDVSATFGLSTSMYAFDLYGPGSTVAFPVDVAATKPMYLERDGIDLDELGVDLPAYKVVQSVYPQARIDSDAQPLQFQFGSADYFGQPAVFGAVQTYDGASLYKCDFGIAGRYLSLRVTFPDYKYVSISGFDLDLGITGER